MKKHLAIFLLLCLIPTFIFAQKEHSLILLDKSNNLPVVGASYHYDSMAGTTGEDGIISLKGNIPTSLKISHIAYGKWELKGQALLEALQSGLIYRENRTVNLYPISIIAVQNEQNEAGKIALNYEDKMAHDAGELLSQDAAISSIRKSGNYGFDPVLRGYKYEQLNIVLNGCQGALAACPNRMDPPTSQMAPNMIDRIEILKGPHALRYGNAFGGTINFIPSPLKYTSETNAYGRLTGGYDSNGNILRTEGNIGIAGNRYDLGLFGSWSEGNDYTDGNGELVQADFLRYSFGINTGLKLSENQQIKLTATKNTARDSEFAALPMDLRNDDTWLLNARHDISFSERNAQSWSTALFASLVHHEMDNLEKNIEPRTVNASTLANTQNFGGRTEGIWKFETATIYTGADFRIEAAQGTRKRVFLMGPNAGNTFEDNVWQNGHINKGGLFSEMHLNKGKTQLVISGRLEVNLSSLGDPDQNFTNSYSEVTATQLNPGISIGGVHNIAEHLSIGLWAGRVQRSGSLTERFINYFPVGLDPYEMLGNPQILPEVNNQADLTLTWRSAKTEVHADLFACYLQNLISSRIDPALSPRLPSSPGVRVFDNISDAFKTGFEISWSQDLFAGLQHKLNVAYTYGQDLALNEALPEIAPLDLSYSLLGTYLEKRLQPEIKFRHVMRQDRISSEFGESTSPAFNLMDIKISYRFDKMIRLSTGVRNLFNTAYYEHLNRSVRGTADPIYSPGRSFFASVSLLLH